MAVHHTSAMQRASTAYHCAGAMGAALEPAGVPSHLLAIQIQSGPHPGAPQTLLTGRSVQVSNCTRIVSCLWPSYPRCMWVSLYSESVAVRLSGCQAVRPGLRSLGSSSPCLVESHRRSLSRLVTRHHIDIKLIYVGILNIITNFKFNTRGRSAGAGTESERTARRVDTDTTPHVTY